MLAYRTDEDTARLVAAELERETADLWRENTALATKLARTEAARDAALERLAEAGPGGGRPSARRDRTGLGALVFAFVAVALLPLHFALPSADVTVLPVIALLGAPGALAACVAWRYRRVSRANHASFVVGAGMAVWTFLEFLRWKL